MTRLRPGTSPPPVRMPIRLAAISRSVRKEWLILGPIHFRLNKVLDIRRPLHAGQATLKNQLCYLLRDLERGAQDRGLRWINQPHVEIFRGDLFGHALGGLD